MLGQKTMIPALEEAVSTMKPGGIRQVRAGMNDAWAERIAVLRSRSPPPNHPLTQTPNPPKPDLTR